jgi:hypothetical protein
MLAPLVELFMRPAQQIGDSGQFEDIRILSDWVCFFFVRGLSGEEQV